MGVESLFAVLFAFFIVTVSPGPANIAVAAVSMSKGRAKGMRFGLGLATGLAFWGVITATGLGVVLQASTTALFALKLFGACYLLWLAYQSARSVVQPTHKVKATEERGHWYYRGLLMNLSNPKAVVAWMAALSMGLGAGDDVAQLIAITAICMGIGVLNYLGHALLFSISGIMSGYQRFRRWIDGMVAGLFAAVGLGLLKNAFSR